jgi:glutamate-ammonia-ligase adenylyltransferase
MRQRLETSRGGHDLKRAPGGLTDVEFAVQLLKIKHGRSLPEVRTAGTREALAALRAAGLLAADEEADLRAAYDFLVRVQGRLRIAHNRSLDELPEPPEEVEKLARRLGFEPAPAAGAGPRLLAELGRHTARTRELFLRVAERERMTR